MAPMNFIVRQMAAPELSDLSDVAAYAARRYLQGATWATIRNETGLPQSTLRRRLKAVGIKFTRPGGKPVKG